jgi:hypothetical protein
MIINVHSARIPRRAADAGSAGASGSSDGSPFDGFTVREKRHGGRAAVSVAGNAVLRTTTQVLISIKSHFMR